MFMTFSQRMLVVAFLLADSLTAFCTTAVAAFVVATSYMLYSR